MRISVCEAARDVGQFDPISITIAIAIAAIHFTRLFLLGRFPVRAKKAAEDSQPHISHGPFYHARAADWRAFYDAALSWLLSEKDAQFNADLGWAWLRKIVFRAQKQKSGETVATGHSFVLDGGR